MKNFKFEKGFTLVEILTVIGVLGVLSIATFTVLNPFEQTKKAYDVSRKADLVQIQKALEAYYGDKGRYPRTTGSAYYCLQDFSAPFTYYCGGSNWSPYMNLVPKDPNSSHRYVYYAPSDGQSYYIYANLERGSRDPQTCGGNGSACSSLSTNNIPSSACGSGVLCNYGVSSPNVTP